MKCYLLIPSDNYPKTKAPTIDIKLVNNKIRLICEVSSTDTSASVRHEMGFYQVVPDKLLATKILAGAENEAFIENSEQNHLFKLSNDVCFFCFTYLYFCRFCV